MRMLCVVCPKKGRGLRALLAACHIRLTEKEEEEEEEEEGAAPLQLWRSFPSEEEEEGAAPLQ